jgi:hypothetical protein
LPFEWSADDAGEIYAHRESAGQTLMKRTNAWEESVALNRPKARIHSAFAVKGAANTCAHARCAPLPSRIHRRYALLFKRPDI